MNSFREQIPLSELEFVLYLVMNSGRDAELKHNKVHEFNFCRNNAFLQLTARNFSIGILFKMSIQDSVRDLVANLIYEKTHHVLVF